MELYLPIKSEFHPFLPQPRRMFKEVELEVKEEIEKILNTKFIGLKCIFSGYPT